jgi:hypothetical protein
MLVNSSGVLRASASRLRWRPRARAVLPHYERSTIRDGPHEQAPRDVYVVRARSLEAYERITDSEEVA